MAEKIVYEIETQSISMVRWALKKHPNSARRREVFHHSITSSLRVLNSKI